MLVLNNRIPYLVCDEITDVTTARKIVQAAFAFHSTLELEIGYRVLSTFPKLIVQNTPSYLSDNLYEYENKIEIFSDTEAHLISQLSKYADEFIIVDDFTFTTTRTCIIDVYLLKDFLYKDKIQHTLRAILINEILTDLS